MKHRHHIFSLVFAVVLLLPLPVRAITSSYYNSINGQKETALRNALYTITSVGPYGMSYDGLWTAYQTTDVYPSDSTGKAGKIWDMYSDCLFTPTGKGDGKQCGTYSGVCDCFNREHSLPKSWFNEKTPAYYDLGHIVPTDGKVNGMRSNNVFGECASGYATWGTGKLGKAKAVTTMNVKGSSTITTTFTGTAFEPADKYKGDFARMYMYMVIRYKPGNSNSVDLAAAGEGRTMFNSTDTNYGLTDYSIALLMKWHRQDPVSQKEIDRNNGMETTQGNRNPFIDYPCLAEYLWGNKAGQAVTLSELVGTFTGSWTSGDGCPCVGPTITSPTGTVNIGTTNTSNSIYKDVTVQGTNLESGSLTLTIGGTNDSYFKLPGGASSTTITKAQAEAGYNITITYTPTANGSHTATLTISGCGVTSHVVELTGTCTTVYTATWMADGSQVGTSYAASGTRPDVPASNPTNCSASRVFVGWTATSGYSGNSAPGDLFTTTAPTITTDKTFYAVYADKSTSAGGGTGSETLTCSAGTIDNNTMRFNTTNFSVEHAKGISANFASYSPWRIYNGNTVTISGSFSITSVVITCGSNDYAKVASNAKLTPTGGGTVSASASSTTCTIAATGTVTSLVISPSAQTRWSEIKINYSGGGSITYSNYSTQCTASSCTLSSITLNTSSVQKSFSVGDAFNYTGLIVTANYSDCESKTVTPTSVSSPVMSTTGNKTVTVSYTESGTTKTATYTITVEAAPEYTVTFMNKGVVYATETNYIGEAITCLPAADPEACDGYTFAGWSTQEQISESTTKPSTATPTKIPAATTTYFAVYSRVEGGGGNSATPVTDVLNNSLIGISGTSYSAWTGKTATSNAVYAGNSAGGNSAIQLRSKNNTSGIVTTTSGETLSKVIVTWNSNTTSGRTLNVYGANSAYSSAADLYNTNTQGTLLGTIVNGTSTELEISDSYTHVGVRSADGAMYLDEIQIIWTTSGGSSTTYTTAPDCGCKATITITAGEGGTVEFVEE